uniref:TLC domain-containing protein n=1 Tax=viral metagenome TaxID=1070528 RepID=A0A6C0JZ33_9ZZZZ
MLEELVYTALWMGLFASLDHLIRYLKYEKPYYAVHALHNALIVYATGSDLVHTFTDLYNLQMYATNWFAIQLCFALHLYHCALYWKSFRSDDWLHHGLMIGVALPIGCIPEAHTFTGMSLFFTTGLPGGIDYALLFSVRNGWIDRHTEKRINAFLNVWIRSPGCMAMAALSIACNLSQPSVYWITLLPSLLNYWNGQYFMQQVLTDSVMKLN